MALVQQRCRLLETVFLFFDFIEGFDDNLLSASWFLLNSGDQYKAISSYFRNKLVEN